MSTTTSPTDAFVEAIVAGVAQRLNARDGIRPRLLTVDDAAKYLSRTVPAIRQLINDGKLPTVKMDKRVFLDIQDIDRVIEASKI